MPQRVFRLVPIDVCLDVCLASVHRNLVRLALRHVFIDTYVLIDICLYMFYALRHVFIDTYVLIDICVYMFYALRHVFGHVLRNVS